MSATICSMVPSPASRSPVIGWPDRRNAIRGTNWGCPASAAMAFSFPVADRNHSGANRSGCHGSPRRTARRMAAGLFPPIHTGICAVR